VEIANNYLYQNQVEGGGWATDWETAHALLAVASATADTSLYSCEQTTYSIGPSSLALCQTHPICG